MNVRLQIEWFGGFLLFLFEAARLLLTPPYRFRLIFQQMEFIGNQSFNIIVLTGFFTGAVFGLQIGGVFLIFKAESLLGGATGLALATELAPLLTGFLLTGRAGSAMTAEISTMVVNEQVDALEVMAVDPLHYLATPRIWASLLMMPLLCGLFMFVGTVGAWVVGVMIFEVDQGIFYDKILFLVAGGDIVTGLRKMVFFAFFIAAIACFYGIRASGGAKGVGKATTDSVVNTLVVILIADFIISFLELRWLK